ncbi:MAG TPA: hypothetical protein DCX95_00680 [Elusimicrobia bacterium]|nr:hypothetical protein [Elusimicrobiota bacterium]
MTDYNIFFRYDVLNIHTVMAKPYTVINALAWILFIFLGIFSIWQENIKAISGDEPSYKKLIIQGLLIACGLGWYPYIFTKIVALCEVISMSIVDARVSASLWMTVADGTNKAISNISEGDWVVKAIEKIPWGVGKIAQPIVTSVITLPQMLLGQMTVWILYMVKPLLLTVRYVLLCLLYVIGPLTFGAAIFTPTSAMLKGWFTNVLQVSFWVVMFTILEDVFAAMNIDVLSRAGYTDIVPWLIVCVIFIGLYIMVPMLTAKILSGQNIGTMGTAAIAMATIAAAKFAGTPANPVGAMREKIAGALAGGKESKSGSPGGGTGQHDDQSAPPPATR